MNKDFYRELPSNKHFEELTDISKYVELPDDWLIVITDVENSTQAIHDGKYQLVNMMGVAVLAAILKKSSLRDIPFVFGGDGALVCIPPHLNNTAREILEQTVYMSQKEFGLSLRAGIIPYSQLQAAKQPILITKFKVSEVYDQALFSGNGTVYAESLLKHPDFDLIKAKIHTQVDYNSLECRWDEVKSPLGNSLSLLIKARSENPEEQFMVYRNWLQFLEEIVDEQHNKAVQENTLKLSGSFMRLIAETKLKRSGQSFFKRFFKTTEDFIRSQFGKYFIKNEVQTGDTQWGNYKSDFVMNSDVRKFDDMIRQILACTYDQEKKILDYLYKEEQKGKLVYGHHSTDSAIVTCMIFKYEKEHVHFVDGNHGGYALAAKELKVKLQAIKPNE